jgi:hypothetical protein
MDAHRGVKLGIRGAHHRGHRAAGGEPGHISAPRIEAMPRHHLPGYAGDQRRLAFASLVLRLEPVPAARSVRLARLRRIDGGEAELVGEPVHTRAGGEIFRILLASMQHDDERHAARRAVRRQVQGVSAAADSIGKEPAPHAVLPPRRSALLAGKTPLNGRSRLDEPARAKKTRRAQKAGNRRFPGQFVFL